MTGISDITPDSVGSVGPQRWAWKVGQMLNVQYDHVMEYFGIPEETLNPEWACKH